MREVIELSAQVRDMFTAFYVGFICSLVLTYLFAPKYGRIIFILTSLPVLANSIHDMGEHALLYGLIWVPCAGALVHDIKHAYNPTYRFVGALLILFEFLIIISHIFLTHPG